MAHLWPNSPPVYANLWFHHHQLRQRGDPRSMMNDEEAELVVDRLLDQLRDVVAGLLEATDNDLDRLEAVERRIFDRRRGAPDRRYLNAAVTMTNIAAQAVSEA